MGEAYASGMGTLAYCCSPGAAGTCSCTWSGMKRPGDIGPAGLYVGDVGDAGDGANEDCSRGAWSAVGEEKPDWESLGVAPWMRIGGACKVICFGAAKPRGYCTVASLAASIPAASISLSRTTVDFDAAPFSATLSGSR